MAKPFPISQNSIGRPDDAGKIRNENRIVGTKERHDERGSEGAEGTRSCAEANSRCSLTARTNRISYRIASGDTAC